MRIKLTALLFVGISMSIYGQESGFPPCSRPADWSKVMLSEAPLPDKAQKFLVVTNRPYDSGAPDGVLYPNEVSEFRKVSYLLAACDGEKWIMQKLDSFTAGMKAIDNGRDILLFVHGHGKSLPAVLTRGHQVADKYDVSMILFDWPSFNSNFNKSLSRVRRCGENYYNLLLQLQEYRSTDLDAGQHLSMLLHSLGNYFLTHLVVNGNNQYIRGEIFDNVIMNSAAVRSKEHGEVISQIKMQNQLYVVYNKNDRVLRGAHLLTSGKMLGNVVMEPLASGATYIDFTDVAGSQHTYFAGYHDFEFEHPAFEQVFYTAFHGGKVDLSNPDLFSRQGDLPIWVVLDKKHVNK